MRSEAPDSSVILAERRVPVEAYDEIAAVLIAEADRIKAEDREAVEEAS